MRKLKMNVKDDSWVSRTMTFLKKVTLRLEDTRVTMTDKQLIKVCMRSVEPYRLQKRMYSLMELDCADDKAAEKNIMVWKSLFRREARLDWESEFRLRSVKSEDKRRHIDKKGIRRFSRGSGDRHLNNVRFKSRNLFGKNPSRPYHSNVTRTTRANNHFREKKATKRKTLKSCH